MPPGPILPPTPDTSGPHETPGTPDGPARRSGPLVRAARGLLLAAAVLAGGLLALATALLSPTPLVRPAPPPTVEEMAHARALWRLHDPRRSAPGQLRSASLSQGDLDLLLSRLAAPWLGTPMRVALEPGRIELLASAELHALPAPWRWLDLRVRIAAHDGTLELVGVRLGALPLPGVLARPLAHGVFARVSATAGVANGPAALDAALHLLRSVAVERGRVSVLYQWQPEVVRAALAGSVAADDVARLRAHGERLAALLAAPPADGAGSADGAGALPLSELLPPLFELARQRGSTPEETAREHRALLLTLALHATGRTAASLVPQARAWAEPPPRPLSLGGRADFAQHFLVSAFLALEAGSPLSDAVGVYKELSDARGGSGFSFNDIAADRAGTRFGELALREPALLQARLAAGLRDADLLPPVDDLPEFLDEQAFLRHYGGVGAPAYEAMRADIERRVAATPVLR